ncbi:hypothetical protein INO04_14515, partial [Staphylococcus aureus]|nr:hypothetical protein [Staphylococcus aureus]MBO8500545.1 hypothetical protein [Staphylococcus aureus]
DRSFINCQANQIPTVVEKVVTSAVNKGYTMADIQVLAPMYKGTALKNWWNNQVSTIDISSMIMSRAFISFSNISSGFVS